MQTKSMTLHKVNSSIKKIKGKTKVLGYKEVKELEDKFSKHVKETRSLSKFDTNAYEICASSIKTLSWLKKLLLEENRIAEDDEYKLKSNKATFLSNLITRFEGLLRNPKLTDIPDLIVNLDLYQKMIYEINEVLANHPQGIQGIRSRVRDSLMVICEAIGSQYEKKYNQLLNECKERWRLETSRHIQWCNPNSIFAKSIKRHASGPELNITEMLTTMKELFMLLQAKLCQELAIEKMAIVGKTSLKTSKIMAAQNFVTYIEDLLNLPRYPDQETLKTLIKEKIHDMDHDASFHRWREGATSRVETLVQLMFGVLESKKPELVDDKMLAPTARPAAAI